eukprot:14477841-Alexandrium_andersonii.AAC.1
MGVAATVAATAAAAATVAATASRVRAVRHLAAWALAGRERDSRSGGAGASRLGGAGASDATARRAPNCQ